MNKNGEVLCFVVSFALLYDCHYDCHVMNNGRLREGGASTVVIVESSSLLFHERKKDELSTLTPYCSLNIPTLISLVPISQVHVRQ